MFPTIFLILEFLSCYFFSSKSNISIKTRHPSHHFTSLHLRRLFHDQQTTRRFPKTNHQSLTIASNQLEPDDQNHLNVSPSASPPPHPRRAICPNCTRPNPVCLCHTLPSHPIPTQTQIIILHHPHEAQHKLSTTPILTKTLSNATTIVSRRLRPGLRPGLSPLLDQSPPSIYLFPQTQSSPALNLTRMNNPNSPLSKHPPSVLIVFDTTWKHAREMVKASEGFLSGFAIRVCLDTDERVEGGSIYDLELVLRKEPFGGCVTTMEAVARALRVIEPNGLEIEEKMIGVLREMVRLQAGFLRNVKPRPKLLKKGKSKEKTQDSNCTSSEY